jgi:pimeloyl-ACP methyl ester carboxylesterase
VDEIDLTLADGRTLHVYDRRPAGTPDRGSADELAVFWGHGTPNLGMPPRPLFAAADRLGLRWVSHDRPGYGGSTSRPGRDIASDAADVAAIADALGIARFAAMGHSGGGPHALACAALLPDRMAAVVSVAGPAPYGADGLDWFAGMARSGVTSLQAAVAGREAKERLVASDEEYDPEFTPADLAAFAGAWGWFGEVVGPAIAAGPGPLIDDDLALVAPWRFTPADVACPALFLHGGRDRVIPCSHSEWLAERCPHAELWLRPEDGHISVLAAGEAALDWLRERAEDP